MKAYRNPYKYRLWLGSLDHNLLNDRQKRELVWILGWGKKGCDSWNYRLAREFSVSVRTIQRDLRLLKYHHLIIILPGWAQLLAGSFTKPLRSRRIYAIPYLTKSSWMIDSLRKSLDMGGDKNVILQRRTRKTRIWEQRKALLNSEGK